MEQTNVLETPMAVNVAEQASTNATQRWLGIFACFTVAWGVLSLVIFVASITATPETLSRQYSPTQMQYLLYTPVWAAAGKAFTACGLLVGAVYLLLRKTSAYYWFMWSLVGTLMVMLDSAIRGGFHILGGMNSGVNIASIIVGIFIFWTSYTAVQEGQLQSE